MSQISTCPHCGQTHREGARFCPTTGRALGPEAAAPVVPEMPTGQTGKLPPSTLLNKRYAIIEKIGQGVWPPSTRPATPGSRVRSGQ